VDNFDLRIINNLKQLDDVISEQHSSINQSVFDKIISVVDGADALIKAKPRTDSSPGTKGDLANKIEAEIAKFDNKQRHGYMIPMSGIQRIRGLAGSGKTVILAMKAALTHLQYPDATILFTFHTKSLYQIVQKLITRFYRQFSDGIPDFESRIKILHAWGGAAANGVYYQACIDHEVPALSLAKAKEFSTNPFDAACSNFLGQAKNIVPCYDFAFVDEGQDFPVSFLQLVVQLTKDQKVVWAYDELQSIFSTEIPSLLDIVGPDRIADDTILYKCYRNPREILVCAHALGFGIYSNKIVQMLETKDRWESIGYKIESGDFIAGHSVKITRPKENTLTSISDAQNINQIIKSKTFDTFDDEINYCANCIEEDLRQGLRPDDILVISIDDRNAKQYLNSLAALLHEKGIKTNNIHSDVYSLIDFEKEGMVTLSTINKAKGNEAYSVYVLGIDAVFWNPLIKSRNKIFTALTRAKGWVTITGIGEPAENFEKELDLAKQKFPTLEFIYPTEDELAIIKDDMQPEKMHDAEEEKAFDELFSRLGAKKFFDLVQRKKDETSTGIKV